MTTQETALLLRWQQEHDAEAFAALVSRYSGLVYGTCRRMLGNPHDAQDAAQQCFMRLARADATSIAYLGGWLHRVAANLCRDHVKREVRRRHREHAYTEATPDTVQSSWDDLQQHIDEAIEALPEGSRFAIQAHFLEGRTHDDIARELNITRSGVTHRIERGIKQVRELLGKQGMLVGFPALTASMQSHLAEEVPASVKAALGRLAVAGPTAIVKGTAVNATALLTTTILGVLALVAVVVFVLTQSPSRTTATGSPANSAVSSTTESSVDTTASSVVDSRPSSPSVSPVASEGGSGPRIANATSLAESNGNEPALAASPVETEDVMFRCVDTDGNPVSGAEVYLVQITRRSPPMQFPADSDVPDVLSMGPVTSRADGIVWFYGVPVVNAQSKRYRTAYAKVPGKLVGALSTFRATSEKPTEQSVIMVPSIEVHGKVNVPDGFNPATVTVHVMSFHVLSFNDPRSAGFPYLKDLEWRNVFEATPDTTGEFAIPDLPSDGAVYLAANGPGLGQAQFYTFDPANVELAEIQMAPEAVIEGRLSYGRDDQPAAGFTVNARPERGGVTSPIPTQTGPDGSFRFDGLAEGEYHLIVPVGAQPSQWNCAVRDLTVKAGETVTNVQLVLEDGQLISGTVRDQESNEPLDGVMVVGLYGDVGGQSVASTVTGPSGTYRFRMPGGHVLLYLASIPKGYVYPKDQGRKPLRIVPNAAEQENVDFVLARETNPTEYGSATVYGRVVDLDGNPVAKATIYENRVAMHGEQKMQTGGKVTSTDENGDFTYLTVAPCTSSFRVVGLGYRSTESDPVDLAVDSEVDIGNLVVERVRGEIAGSVVDTDGNPIPGAKIHIEATNFSDSSLKSDKDGLFFGRGIPEDDEIIVNAEKVGYTGDYAPVDNPLDCRIVLKSRKSSE